VNSRRYTISSVYLRGLVPQKCCCGMTSQILVSVTSSRNKQLHCPLGRFFSKVFITQDRRGSDHVTLSSSPRGTQQRITRALTTLLIRPVLHE
jgi:hypothetical protein